MKKLSGRQKRLFENPVENLDDLFRFISREIENNK